MKLIPRIALRPAAELALMSLQVTCLGPDHVASQISLGSLNADSKELLGICWDLKIKGYHREDAIHLSTNRMLREHITWVSEQVNYDDLAKLAILTWHFDASSQFPSRQLFCFLAHPYNNIDDFSVLKKSYSNLPGCSSTGWSYEQDFMELLSFLKNHLKDEWNVTQNGMSLVQSTATQYSISSRNPPVMPPESCPSHDGCRQCSSFIATDQTPQNDGTSCPEQSSQPDLPSEKNENNEEQRSGGHQDKFQDSTVTEADSAEAQDTEQQRFISLQPEPHPMTEEGLTNEVRDIYSGLVMVEEKCIEYQQLDLPKLLSQDQWLDLVSLHRLLLHNHNDFFLASQHPFASPALRQLVEKYSLPDRIWRHGIQSFLDFLLERLPGSREYLDTFIQMAYEEIKLHLEGPPAFKDIWMECLGDLARYGMFINPPERETVNPPERAVWISMALHWYLQLSDRNPDNGRIQHHLAVVAWPDLLQQLFYYTKSLLSVRPFVAAKGSVVDFLFNPVLESGQYDQPVTAFVAAHGYLFKQYPISYLRAPVKQYLSQLREYINEIGEAFKVQGAYMALCNFAAIFHGSADAVLPREKKGDSSEMIYCGSLFAFETFSIILDQIGNEHVYPAVYVYLAFVWSMVRNDTMEHIDELVPWKKITTFLNSIGCSDIDFGVVEYEEFPIMGDRKHMPEDFLIRGYVWSQGYFPDNFFEDAEDDGHSIEVLSMRASRMHRCLWLGRQLSKVCFILFLQDSC